jgi:hypothetical protein
VATDADTLKSLVASGSSGRMGTILVKDLHCLFECLDFKLPAS